MFVSILPLQTTRCSIIIELRRDERTAIFIFRGHPQKMGESPGVAPIRLTVRCAHAHCHSKELCVPGQRMRLLPL